MRILSWNVYHKNKKFKEIYEFIKGLRFDILALQEVSPELLRMLKELPYAIVYGSDFDNMDMSGHLHHADMVIITRYQIYRQEVISLPPELYSEEGKHLRSRLFHQLIQNKMRPDTNRGALRVELLLPDWSKIQVFCVHAGLWTPESRLKEFDLIMERRNKELPIFVCGDLNTLDLPHIASLNWILGGKMSSLFQWTKERRILQRRFVALSLRNPLQGTSTHQLALCQLDHILIPEMSVVSECRALSNRVGSDHNPVLVEMTLQNKKA